MQNLSFYILTSNPSLNILPATAYLYNKYWQRREGIQKYKILGQDAPLGSLPENFEFIKIRNENNMQVWTRNLHDYILKNEKSKYFILTLDDFLPNSPLKPEILDSLLAYAESRQKVGRIALGVLDVEPWEEVRACPGYKIVKLKDDAVYRLSCQTSIWNREYFLKYFNNDWTPWQLELVGSKIAKHDNWEILGTDGDWAFRWVEESALSGRWPGMINILGVRPEDIKYLIAKEIFKPEFLQYGIWYDCKIPFISRFQFISKRLTKIPKFSEIGYNFKWDLIKPYVRRKTFNRLFRRYKNIYPA